MRLPCGHKWLGLRIVSFDMWDVECWMWNVECGMWDVDYMD